MVYFGGLTFYREDPARYLKIPNKIAAKRIAKTVISKYGLKYLPAALIDLRTQGNIQGVLNCYRDLMVYWDVGEDDFNKSEEIHRDSFHFSLLQNHFLHPSSEYKVTKVIKCFTVVWPI